MHERVEQGRASPWRPSEIEIGVALAAYRQGAFPMAGSGSGGRHPDFEWFLSDPRAVLPVDGLRISRSLRRRVRSERFTITGDVAFDDVLSGCQEAPRPELGTWISDDYRSLLGAFHRQGHAHSVEAWRSSKDEGRTASGKVGSLVGGIYGVVVGGVFCAESMFHRPGEGGTDASKVCLCHLVAHLAERGFALLDTQILNPFTESLGVGEIPHEDYLALLTTEADRAIEWRAERIAECSGEEVLERLAAGATETG